MRHGRHATRLARLGAFLGICTSSLGGPAYVSAGNFFDRLRPASRSAVPVLAPRTIVAWSIDSADDAQPTHVKAGKGIIGPDGTLVIGPYGSVAVAGLTPLQAATTIERHLAAFVGSPRVRLTVEGTSRAPTAGPTGVPTTVARTLSPARHQPPLMAGPAALASWQTTNPPAQPVVMPTAATDPELTAHLGAPAPFDGTAPTMADWKPVQRPTDPVQHAEDASTGTAASTWRSAGQPAASVVKTAFQAPMPMGPPDHPGPTSATAQPEPKAEDLKTPPRPVPGQPEGPVIIEGAGPGCAVPGVGPFGHGMPAPRECAKMSLPPYVIEPPDILIIESTQQIRDQPIRGQHLVRPDGTVALGIYGIAPVAGLNLEQAKEMIARVLEQRINNFERKNLYVDVLAYNSKFYYVITDGGGYGEQVIRLPITGSETVLDGISQINGLPPVASKKAIWVARSFPCQGGHGSETVLPVDWCAITQRGNTATNYQIMPGDRIYVKAQKLIRIDSAIAKVLSPIERLLGITLLGSSTVNSIRNSNNNQFGP